MSVWIISSSFPEICLPSTEKFTIVHPASQRSVMNKPNLVPAPPRVPPSSRCSNRPPCWKQVCSTKYHIWQIGNQDEIFFGGSDIWPHWLVYCFRYLLYQIFPNQIFALTGIGVLFFSMFPTQSPTFHFLHPIGSGILSATFLMMEVSPWKYEDGKNQQYQIEFFSVFHVTHLLIHVCI